MNNLTKVPIRKKGVSLAPVICYRSRNQSNSPFASTSFRDTRKDEGRTAPDKRQFSPSGGETVYQNRAKPHHIDHSTTAKPKWSGAFSAGFGGFVNPAASTTNTSPNKPQPMLERNRESRPTSFQQGGTNLTSPAKVTHPSSHTTPRNQSAPLSSQQQQRFSNDPPSRIYPRDQTEKRLWDPPENRRRTSAPLFDDARRISHMGERRTPQGSPTSAETPAAEISKNEIGPVDVGIEEDGDSMASRKKGSRDNRDRDRARRERELEKKERERLEREERARKKLEKPKRPKHVEVFEGIQLMTLSTRMDIPLGANQISSMTSGLLFTTICCARSITAENE